jgi:superkiller protein 3
MSTHHVYKPVADFVQHRQHFIPAIEAFQIALRADVDDQLSWLRLGEAYSKAGRFAAALKALARAHELDPEDWMCTYFTGEVLRQTGQFSEAISAFESILVTRPAEISAIMALAQSNLDLARVEELAGFEARAESSFMVAIKIALEAIDCSPGFRAMSWKIIADALYGLSQRSSYMLEDEVRHSLASIMAVLGAETSPRLGGLFTLGQGTSENVLRGSVALELALAAYDYRLSLLSKEDHAYGSALADLAVSLHTWTRSAVDSEKASQAEKEAVSCIMASLRCDPGFSSYWIILGDIQFVRQPKVAQHAYIKALELDKTVRHLVKLCFLAEGIYRMLSRGRILGCCICTMTTSLSQTRLYFGLRRSIPITL